MQKLNRNNSISCLICEKKIFNEIKPLNPKVKHQTPSRKSRLWKVKCFSCKIHFISVENCISNSNHDNFHSIQRNEQKKVRKSKKKIPTFSSYSKRIKKKKLYIVKFLLHLYHISSVYFCITRQFWVECYFQTKELSFQKTYQTSNKTRNALLDVNDV